MTEETDMNDKIEKIGNFTVQHGKHNNRIYLTKFSWENFPAAISQLDILAGTNGYTKILAKVPALALTPFVQNNYVIEAFVPGYYNNTEDCIMVSKFFSKLRSEKPVQDLSEFYNLSAKIENNGEIKYRHSLKFLIRILNSNDVGQITDVYKKVFETYPFPVFEPRYILKTMEDKSVHYFGIFDKTKLIGISSAEIDVANKNAEMTDFAILPEYRGQNMGYKLLNIMENEMKALNIKTLYTIARLKSPGINIIFLKNGYKLSGFLINNTNISGKIESMNVYYKSLL